MKKEDVKVIFADVDGTLIGEDHIMKPLTSAMLNRLHNDGIKLGLASGRQVGKMMFTYAEEWGLDFQFDYFIGMNGGQLYTWETKELHEMNKLSRDTIRRIIEMMEPLDLNPFRYQGEAMICKRMDEGMRYSGERNHLPVIVADQLSDLWAEDNAKILFRVPEDEMPPVYEYAKAHPDKAWQCFLTQPTMLEFMDPAVNKGNGLKAFSEKTGIAMENIMAFGDMDNDTEMLRTAGWGVCLAQGAEGTKAASDAVTEYDVEHDGVGHYIEDHFYTDTM